MSAPRFVICRMDDAAPNGCRYWTGSLACLDLDDAGVRTYTGEADSRNAVLVIDDAEKAAALALWLNTCPAPARSPRPAGWQALPIGQFGGAA